MAKEDLVNDLIADATGNYINAGGKEEKVFEIETDTLDESGDEESAEEIIEESDEAQDIESESLSTGSNESEGHTSAASIVQDIEEEVIEEKLETGDIPEVDLSDVLEGKDSSTRGSAEDNSRSGGLAKGSSDPKGHTGEASSQSPKSIITSSTVDEIDNEFVRKEEDAESLVEAALFVAGKFMSMQDLIVLTDLNQIMIKDVIKKLEKKYKDGAIRIVERNNMYKMDLAQQYHFLINRLASGEAEFTKAEQETLAVIAYKQPVKQSVVIKIRGNKSYDHIKKFKDLGLVVARPVGHTLELSLSDEFYEYFNLHNKGESED